MTLTSTDLSSCLNNVRDRHPLVHCITNYVTINDCANALLACGGSPIMGDEPADVVDVTSICDALVLNIGTLNRNIIEAMHVAGARAAELGHPIVLDPVGAGASRLRTETAAELLEVLPIAVVRGNMSEMRALAGASASTRGVDVNPEDAVHENNLAASSSFARQLSSRLNAVVAITGAIDVIATADRAVACRNGVALMGSITGTGCMLSAIMGAYAAANANDLFSATVAVVACEGLAGQIAAERMGEKDGTGSFHTYLLDALSNMDAAQLESGALIEEL
ncbi:MAG: hydroxyethylthiazole kinase [Coriobacteriaceae bacterium]|nr:hydroxyethylthiazole kinase [Coriobacteriaceae bacterium]